MDGHEWDFSDEDDEKALPSTSNWASSDDQSPAVVKPQLSVTNPCNWNTESPLNELPIEIKRLIVNFVASSDIHVQAGARVLTYGTAAEALPTYLTLPRLALVNKEFLILSRERIFEHVSMHDIPVSKSSWILKNQHIMEANVRGMTLGQPWTRHDDHWPELDSTEVASIQERVCDIICRHISSKQRLPDQNFLIGWAKIVDMSHRCGMRLLTQLAVFSSFAPFLSKLTIVTSMTDPCSIAAWAPTFLEMARAPYVRTLDISQMGGALPGTRFGLGQNLLDHVRLARVLNCFPLLENLTINLTIPSTWGTRTSTGCLEYSDDRQDIQHALTSLKYLRRLRLVGPAYVDKDLARMPWACSLTSLSLEHEWTLTMSELRQLLMHHADTLTKLDLRPGIFTWSGGNNLVDGRSASFRSGMHGWRSCDPIKLPRLKNLWIYDRTTTDFTSAFLALIEDSPLESLIIEEPELAIRTQTGVGNGTYSTISTSIVSADELLEFTQRHARTLKTLMPLALDRQEQLEYELALDPICIEHDIELYIKLRDNGLQNDGA